MNIIVHMTDLQMWGSILICQSSEHAIM